MTDVIYSRLAMPVYLSFGVSPSTHQASLDKHVSLALQRYLESDQDS